MYAQYKPNTQEKENLIYGFILPLTAPPSSETSLRRGNDFLKHSDLPRTCGIFDDKKK